MALLENQQHSIPAVIKLLVDAGADSDAVGKLSDASLREQALLKSRIRDGKVSMYSGLYEYW